MQFSAVAETVELKSRGLRLQIFRPSCSQLAEQSEQMNHIALGFIIVVLIIVDRTPMSLSGSPASTLISDLVLGYSPPLKS